jgi:hypothetical protein
MGLLMGLTCIYLSDILASLGASAPGRPGSAPG